MRWSITIIIGIGIIICGVFGVSKYRQGRLSAEVRNAFCSSLSPNASESDVAFYVRAAKLASRTKQDAYVIALLDDFVHVAADNAQRQQGEWNRTLEGLRNSTSCVQYDFKSAARAACGEELKQKMENDQELNSIDDGKIKADEATMNELKPKLKVQKEEYCAGPSVFDAK